jgi:hypothetical protein
MILPVPAFADRITTFTLQDVTFNKLLWANTQGEEDLHVQTLVTQLAVEAFDVAVLDGLARPNEVQMHAVL